MIERAIVKASKINSSPKKVVCNFVPFATLL